MRPPNGGRNEANFWYTARPMWLTAGRVSHEAVYVGRPQAGAGPAGRRRPRGPALARGPAPAPARWLYVTMGYTNVVAVRTEQNRTELYYHKQNTYGRLPESHWLKLLPQYVNALSPPIAGERVGVEGWVGNGHLLEAYSTKPTFKPQRTMCSF